MANDFKPRIVGFLCNWCSYRGADLAGTLRMQYPPTILSLRMMCSSRVDPLFVLHAFKEGADGVLVAGCHPGDCHYLNGNYKTRRRFSLLKKMLPDFGIEPDRLHLVWISAAEAGPFAKIIREFTERLKHLGPLNLHLDKEKI